MAHADDRQEMADDDAEAVEPRPAVTAPAAASRESVKGRALCNWIAPVALALAVIAIAIAVWALMSGGSGTAAPDSKQIADAKVRACTAYTTVRTAVALQTHADLGADPVAVQAVAANARLAMASGADYLQRQVGDATPAELAGAIRAFTDDLQDISMNAQAGVRNDDPAQSALLRDAEATSTRIAELCK